MDGIIIPPTGTATITGGSITNTPISGSSGSFTTLSSSGPATFNIWGAATNGAQEIRPNGSASTVGRITINTAGDLAVSSATAGTQAGAGAIQATNGGAYFALNVHGASGYSLNSNASIIWTAATRIKVTGTAFNFRNSADSADAPITAAGVTFSGLTDSGKQIAGVTGAVTQNSATGQVQFAAAATSLVVTNSQCTANSIIIPFLAATDATAVLGSVVAAAGSFTLNMKAAPTGTVKVNWHLSN